MHTTARRVSADMLPRHEGNSQRANPLPRWHADPDKAIDVADGVKVLYAATPRLHAAC